MNLVPYIVSSILLSSIGWGVYLLFRWVRPEAKGRRTMAWLVLLTSLTIPLAYQIDPAGTYSHEAEALAQQLKGKFLRRPNSPQGTICELIWPRIPRSSQAAHGEPAASTVRAESAEPTDEW